ncbi:MAG TPA: TolC family protein, partial [Flavobacterium sp.]|nr:TolC family protein [Flavobacterium sp.]
MKSIRYLIAAVLMTSLATAQDDQATDSFSLKQAIEHALQYNYRVINASRDIQAAEKKKWETTAAGLP